MILSPFDLNLNSLKELRETISKGLRSSKYKKMYDLKKENRSLFTEDYFISRLLDIDVELKHYSNYLYIIANVENYFFNLILNREYALLVNIQCSLNLLVDLTLHDKAFDETNLLMARSLLTRLFRYRKEDGIINYGKELDLKVIEQMEYFISLVEIHLLDLMIKEQEK